MKKLLIVLLVLALGFGLCSCVSKPVESEGLAGMTNPIEETTIEAIRSESGLDLTPPADAEVIRVTKINSESCVYSVDFKLDGTEYNYRAKKTDKAEDISGMYYNFTWTDNNDYKVGIADGEAAVLTWYKNGTSYSLSTASDCSADVISAVFFAVA